MLPTYRHMGGIARPKDLRVMTRSTGGHSVSETHTSSPLSSQQPRGFHTTPAASYDSSSYTATEVPAFFVKYKERRASFGDQETRARAHDELGLVPSLTHTIESGDLIASIRRLQAKIPVEHRAVEGHVIHPSGFVVPGPGHTSTSDVARAKERERNEGVDLAMQTAAVAHRVLESDFKQVDATTLPLPHSVPFEVHEPDGTVTHPSGFVPPTPAYKFKYMGNTNVLAGRKVSAPRPRVRQPSPARAVLRAVHTVASDSEDAGDC